MDKDIIIYLHFASMVEEKSWETEFFSLFHLAVKQVTGANPEFLSNIDIPGSKVCNPDNPDGLDRSDIFIIVLNNPNKNFDENDLASLTLLLSRIEKSKQNAIFVTQRFNKKGMRIPYDFQKFPLYNLFELNPKTHEINDFSHSSVSGGNNDYLLKLTDLAYDIKGFLDKNGKDGPEVLREKSVYLAEVSIDQIKNRDRLKRSLQLSGYRVLPGNSLISSEFYEADVKEALNECILSVNILGELYGENPSGSDYSFQELQNRYFHDVWQEQQKNNSPGALITRIIWLPPQLEPFEEKQAQYLKRINREINQSENTELVQSTLSDLQLLIDQKIQILSHAPTNPGSADNNDVLVIADDYKDYCTNVVKETLARDKVEARFLNTLIGQEYHQAELMSIVNKFRDYLVINTKSDSSWGLSVISLLARSKGYEHSVSKGRVGLFFHSPKAGFSNLTSLTIEPVNFNKANLVEKLESFISKGRL